MQPGRRHFDEEWRRLLGIFEESLRWISLPIGHPHVLPRPRAVLSLKALGLAAGMAGALGSPLVAAATRDAHAADDSNARVLWTFVDTHARWFKRRAAEYRKQVNHTFSLTVHQYPNPPYQQKLLTVLQTGTPHLAELHRPA
jgi:ABC-type glycerol-3-phosphate transport system substrate-binding protein